MKSNQKYKLLLVMPSIGFYTFSVYGVDGVGVMLYNMVKPLLKVVMNILKLLLNL